MTLPGVGAKVADKILDIREANGNLQLEDLRHVPCICICIGYVVDHGTVFIQR